MTMTRRWLLLLLLLPLGGCAGGLPVPGLPGARAAGVFPGFDTNRYPGDAALRSWRESSPYQWVGYYLASPCHRDASWMGKREALQGMGWGTAVLYVGQQAFEGQPTDNPGAAAVLCSRTLLDAEQGRRDARDAVAKTAGEGFEQGSVIYLDVERMERTPPEMLAYLRAWTAEVLASGRFRPGVYSHRRNAAELYLAAAEAYRAAGRTDAPLFWVSGGEGFALDRAPRESGFPFATVWQGVLDVDRSWGGVTLRIDENVSQRPSPSAP